MTGLPSSAVVAMRCVTLVAGLCGCRDSVQGATPQSTHVPQTQGTAADESDERDFRSIAAILPGFAGYYYLRGTNRLIIAMSDNTPADSVIRTVTRTFRTIRRGRFGPPAFEVRRVKFPFALLAKLRDKVEARGMGVAGVDWSDLDEEHNRLTFGISEQGAAALVSAIMKSVSAPVGSYGFEPDPSCFDAGGACRLDPATPEQQGIVRDSFEVSLHVPAIVHLGDSVPLRISVRNLSQRRRGLEYGEPAVDFLIADALGRRVWHYLPENQAGLGAFDSLVGLGERQFTVTWNQRDTQGRFVSGGSYRVIGVFDGEREIGDVRLGPAPLQIVR